VDELEEFRVQMLMRFIRSSRNINASMIEHDIDTSNKCYEIGWLQGIDEIQKG